MMTLPVLHAKKFPIVVLNLAQNSFPSTIANLHEPVKRLKHIVIMAYSGTTQEMEIHSWYSTCEKKLQSEPSL